MDAQAVIEELVQRYVAFRSYSDTGQVTFRDFVRRRPNDWPPSFHGHGCGIPLGTD
jgi:hypothetical protein